MYFVQWLNLLYTDCIWIVYIYIYIYMCVFVCVCVCVCVCVFVQCCYTHCLSNSAVQHSSYDRNVTSCRVFRPRPDHQSAVHSTHVIKTHQCQYSFCQTLQGADRAGTCRRTSSCHDSQRGNHVNSRHC